MITGFIGAGKVGMSMAKHFKSHGHTVCGFYTVDTDPREDIFTFAPSPAELLQTADIIFITTPDGEIEKVWREIKKQPLNGKIICHASGALSSAVFDGAKDLGAYAFSTHPLTAVKDKQTPLDNVSFVIEGDASKLEEIKSFFEAMQNPVITINPENKTLYHAACVMVSNLITGLVETGSDLFDKLDIPQSVWLPLFLNNAANIKEAGIINSLTGPVERNDAKTIAAHLAVLEGETKEIYTKLSHALLAVAKQKNPQRDYTETEKVLK
ncbi:putative short-subunit dehydrogenase-like oxidoreductase (DUF2520 family) [Elusimicrobium posterum]|uniref:Rossmann-like and DUF2520 domain-containing protein n=1 Tax=Elusimicrobium posterum TaxID=3116653 RepID=UPI003C76EE02